MSRITLKNIREAALSGIKNFRKEPSEKGVEDLIEKISHMVDEWLGIKTRRLSKWADKPNAAQRWFDRLPEKKQRKYACLGLTGLAGIFILSGYSLEKIVTGNKEMEQKEPPKAEIYDPKGDVEIFLKIEGLTLDDIQNFIDNDPYSSATGRNFPVKLRDMGDETFRIIMQFLINDGIVEKVKKEKKIK